MKKILFFILCAAALAASCSKDISSDEISPKEFVAQNELTKTFLTGTAVKWLITDSIGVFSAAGAPAKFTVKTLENEGASATFTGTVANADTYYAVYPYSAVSSLSSTGKILSSIPVAQSFTTSSFSDGANLAIAKTTNNTLAFKNIGAILCFKVTAADITKVTFSSDAIVAGGTATIDYNAGQPSVVVEGGSNSVEMTGDFVSGNEYYFVVYPGTYNYFSLKFTTSEGKSTTLTNNTIMEVARNAKIKLNDFNLMLTPTINVPGSTTFEGASITFTADDLGDGAEYSWVFEGGSPASSSDRVVTVTYAAKGQYDVTLTEKKGAKSGTTTLTDFVSVYPGNPLLFIPFDGDYTDYGPEGIQVDRVDGPDATELINFQTGRTGIPNSSGYFPGFTSTKYSVLSITDSNFAEKFNSTGNFTISFWFKARNGKTGTSYFYSQGTGKVDTGWHYLRLDSQVAGPGEKYRLFYQIRYTDAVSDDKSISYKYNFDGVNTPKNINIDVRDGAWHHIVVRSLVEGTAPNQTMSWKMYLDGNHLANNAQLVKTLSSYVPFVIGAQHLTSTGGYLNPLQGNIDDFIVWNYGLPVAIMAELSSY